MNDLTWVHRLHSDPEVMKYIRAPDIKPEATTIRILDILANYEKFPGRGIFVVTPIGQTDAIGWGVIQPLAGKPENPVEIGYRFFQEHWGKGYATEVAHTLAVHGFETLKLPYLCGITHPENEASKRVLQKTGLVAQGMGIYYETNCCFFEKFASGNLTEILDR